MGSQRVVRALPTQGDLEKRLAKLTKDQLVQLCLKLGGSLFQVGGLETYVREIRQARVKRDIDEAWAEHERLTVAERDAFDAAYGAKEGLSTSKRLQLQLAAEKAREARHAAWMRWERLSDLEIALYDDPWKGL
ncbi:hypothetical protein SAMN05421508_11375 [Caenispirillum bisanense]|uniref:Uncharacterized protein n=1 Tax=Caenispirillum bisanense TaxID=414052 RepID=A0A286GYQ2_9PROT|nr:hypothetical protein SAMN05421508_11375 [Caenispirillum bisanense]